MIAAIIFVVAIDTTPLKPLPVLLPRPVQSQTTQPKSKQNDKSKNIEARDANSRVLGDHPINLVSR